MEQFIYCLAFKGSIIEAITEALRMKKLVVVYISGDNENSVSMIWLHSGGGIVIEVVHFVTHYGRKHRCISFFCIILTDSCSLYNNYSTMAKRGFVSAEVVA
nr:hypothetical protein [Tanacetum cinerariifolium]